MSHNQISAFFKTISYSLNLGLNGLIVIFIAHLFHLSIDLSTSFALILIALWVTDIEPANITIKPNWTNEKEQN